MNQKRKYQMGNDGMNMNDETHLAEQRKKARREFSKEAKSYSDPATLDWTRILSLLNTGQEDMYEEVVRNLRNNRVFRSLGDNPYVLMTGERMLDITPLAELGFSTRGEAERFAKANGTGTVRKYSEVRDSKRLPIYHRY